MSIVEIRCPHCGSQCHSKDEKRHEYYCDHCGATFRFVDTTKKEIIRDIRRHTCPICGRPVKIDEGYICNECGEEDLCENCVEEIKEYDENAQTYLEKFVCKKCIEKKGLKCNRLSCNSKYVHRCVVCKKQYCDEHSLVHMDNFLSAAADIRSPPFALYCPNCHGNVCLECYEKRTSFFGGKPSYYCKRCGTKLHVVSPLSSEGNRMYDLWLKSH